MIPHEGKQAAHVLLDACAAYSGGDDVADAAAMDLAISRLMEINAVTATMAEDGELDIDLSPLIGGASVLIKFLVHQIALCAETDDLHVVAEARTFIDA